MLPFFSGCRFGKVITLTVMVIVIGLAAPGQASTISLTGTIRDFKRGDLAGGHPDFEYVIADDRGIVEFLLGSDKKPVYAGTPTTPTTTGVTNFNQWYRDTAGVNLSTSHTITLDDSATPGIYTFSSSAFFPIDGSLFGNQGLGHNYHFTYELNTMFTYVAGQSFTFTGDDDVFVFINNRLAIDLGGVHGAETATVDLDAAAALLGITPGSVYDLDFFFAERHTTESNFRIDTSIILGPTAVPEPGSLALLGTGVLGLLGYGLRRRRA